MTRRLLVALLLTPLLVGGTSLAGVLTTPAAAAQCATDGVSVVVDFNRGAGGGISTSCDGSGGGKYASSIFPAAGFPLTYVSGSGGFVCRVAGRAADADCSRTAPANAYWGLFWAAPGSRSWTYATSGVGTLRIPEGGAVAFAFQDGGGTDVPGTAPAQRSSPKPTPKPAPEPAPKPAQKPAQKPTPQPAEPGAERGQGASGAGGTSAPAPAGPTPRSGLPRSSNNRSAAPGATTESPKPRPSESVGSEARTGDSSSSPAPVGTGDTSAASASASPGSIDPAADEQGGLPWWVAAGAVAVLAAGAVGSAWWRRRGPAG